MTISVTLGPIAGAIVSGNNSFTISLGSATVGRPIIVGIGYQSAFSGVSSVACTGESNLTAIGTPTTTANSSKVQLYYLPSVTAAGAKTITITMANTASANNQASAYAAELDGADTSSLLDVSNGATATSASPSVSLTTTAASDAIFAVAIADNTTSGDFTAGSGFTLIALAESTNRQIQGEYKVDAGAAGSKTVDFGLGGSQTWGVAAAALKAAQPTTGTLADTLPSLTGSAGDGITTGSEIDSFSPITIVASGTVGAGGAVVDSLPSMTISSSGAFVSWVVDTSPIFTISATGFAGAMGVMEGVLPLLDGDGRAVSENRGSWANVLPVLTLGARDGDGTSEDVPLLALSATGFSGTVGRVAEVLSVLVPSGTGSFPIIGAGASSLPLLAMDATGVAGTTGALVEQLTELNGSLVGFVGSIGAALLAAPSMADSTPAVGYFNSSGVVAEYLPVIVIDARGYSRPATFFRTWVLNARTQALTEYTGFSFNSFASFDGKMLAAGDGGIFVLGTDVKDNATDIPFVIRTARTGFDSGWLKRVPRVYLDYTSIGAVDVFTITSEDGRRQYTLAPNGVPGQQQRRVPVGQGPKSRFWQFEVANKAGADVSVNAILALPTYLRRRFQ